VLGRLSCVNPAGAAALRLMPTGCFVWPGSGGAARGFCRGSAPSASGERPLRERVAVRGRLPRHPLVGRRWPAVGVSGERNIRSAGVLFHERERERSGGLPSWPSQVAVKRRGRCQAARPLPLGGSGWVLFCPQCAAPPASWTETGALGAFCPWVLTVRVRGQKCTLQDGACAHTVDRRAPACAQIDRDGPRAHMEVARVGPCAQVNRPARFPPGAVPARRGSRPARFPPAGS
jgi:hypothetical protein